MCIEATLGTGTLERAQSRAHVDRPFLISRSHHSPRVQRSTFNNETTFKLATQDDLHVPITLFSALTTSFPFTLPFFSSSRLGLSQTNAYQHNAATMRQLYAPSLSHFGLPFYALTHLPSPAPPRSPLLNKLELADEAAHMYISLPSCSSRWASFSNQVVLSLSLSPFFAHLHTLPSRRSSGGTAVHTISASISHSSCLTRHTHTRTLSLSLSLSHSSTTLLPSQNLS